MSDTLKLEYNGNVIKDVQPGEAFGVLVTPPIGEDYWIMRVPVSDKQAVVCFPKFFTIGIGFQNETDWNTNLPYTGDAEDIFRHIAHNKGAAIQKAK